MGTTFIAILVGSLFWPFVALKSPVRGDADSFVETYYMETNCRPGVKNVVQMRTGAAIFIFDERNLTKKWDKFMCHYELEVPSGYGFHVYFDELELDSSPNPSPGSGKYEGPCSDYVQFGRDALAITTFYSQKYCGSLPRRPLSSDDTDPSINKKQVTSSTRMYVEEQDNEMDVWVKVVENEERHEPRSIYMTVTVIKKHCRTNDAFYRRCPYSPNCVRREFFCDDRVNCAWPSAEHGGTDEANCHLDVSNEYSGPFDTMGINNIPLVIVFIIGAVILLVLGAVVGKRFVSQIFKSRQAVDAPMTSRRQRGLSEGDATGQEQTLSLMSPDVDTSSAQSPGPTAPPSYEDVIKDSNTHPIILTGRNEDPPPYTPSSSTTAV